MEHKYAALFDLDGVVIDTEREYSLIWAEIGARYVSHIPDFAHRIKGTSLQQIFANYFPDAAVQEEITKFLSECEGRMQYDYIAGAPQFIESLHRAGFATAIVTSSNDDKMNCLYKKHPELRDWFDIIITADNITHSKPHPECYLLAAEKLGVPVADCFVFEDSVAGVMAGKAAEMSVVGLTTTFPAEAIAPYSDIIIPDFQLFTYEKLMDNFVKNI